MGAANLSIGRTKLQVALKNLKIKWEDVRRDWTDSVAVRFGEEYVAPIEPKLLATVQGIDQLLQVLIQAEQECQ